MRTYNRAEIAQIIAYLRNGTPPTLESLMGGSAAAESRFRAKYRAPDWAAVATGLEFKNRRVVATEDADLYMQGLYNDAATRLNGRDRLYPRIQETTYGITYDMVMRFLKSQELYQLHQGVYRDKVVKPIVPKAPFELFQVDTVIMHKLGDLEGGRPRGLPALNAGFAYMLTVIDVFSKYAWASPMKRATEANVIDALRAIFAGIGEVPARIQTDRGFEFGQGMANSSFVKFLRENSVVHTVSRAYCPQSQGAIERFNRTIKQMIYQDFTARNSQVWYNRLDILLGNYNSAYHTAIKAIPSKLHDAFIAAPRDRGTKTQVKQIKKKLTNRAEALVATENRLHGQLDVGDHVRIAIVATDAEERKKELSGFRKGFKINWSKEIYVIATISPPRATARQQYRLKTADGQHNVEQILYRWQLQPVDPNLIEIGSAAMPLPPRTRRGGRTVATNVIIPPTALSERQPNARIRRAPRRLIVDDN